MGEKYFILFALKKNQMHFICAQTRVPINLKQAIWITKKKKKKCGKFFKRWEYQTT